MDLYDVHTIAENFLRDLTASRNIQPIAEEVISKEFVNFIRPDGKFFSGIKRDGTQVWASERRFAMRVPVNVIHEYADKLAEPMFWTVEAS